MKKKRFISLLLVLCMVCAIMPTASAYSTVRKGSSGSDVRTLQTMLNAVMSAGLSVDGSFGAKTQAAVKSYQSYKGLSVDGICGPKTWSALEADYNALSSSQDTTPITTVSHSTVRYGSSGSEVKTLQTYLNTLTSAGLTVDGKFGPATQKAVKAYQSSKGLSADGVCGPKTWAALEADVATPPESTLSIGSGRYAPGTLTQGVTYSISGTISSNYTITSVTVGIYDASGNTTSSVKTVQPNAYSYNIYGVDSSIKFGQLQGSENGTTYYLRVTATDASGTTKDLVNNSFTVVKKNCTYSWPLPGKTYISSYFGGRIHPISHKAQNHSGIDIPASTGTSVRAASGGTVYYINTSCTHNYGKTDTTDTCGGGYGNYIIIAHGDGLYTYYAHLTSVSVKQGDVVSQGDVIGTVGSTGNATGPHLHFEMRSGSSKTTRIDPLNYVEPY